MSNNPTKNPLWQDLRAQAKDIKKSSIQSLFDKNENRFDDMHIELNDFLFDYSKQHINSDIIDNLCTVLESNGFKEKQSAMFNGEAINHTEGRSALHTALRRPSDAIVMVDGQNVIPEIHETLQRIKELSDKVKNKTLVGVTGKPIDTIISIGIGGSDLGPRMVYKALSNNPENIIAQCHFVSNVDGDDIKNILNICNPETTLVVIISKTFTTQETLTNAQIAKDWLNNNLAEHGNAIEKHFIAVSSNSDEVKKFGIAEDNFFPMWEWVTGRYSLWSAVGITLALSLGFETFEELLAGAHSCDEHFKSAPLNKNIPVLMALTGVWNRNFLESSNLAVLPYSQRLEHFPAYLQQLEMESNGKDVDSDGNQITDYKTGTTLFGDVGTNGQHSFYQLIHQGSDIMPCDFIAAVKPDNKLDQSHEILLHHMLAQGQALMQGKQDNADDEPYRYFHGNRPSTTILMRELGAHSLGMLIALYEHKTFTQGIFWNINSFDQYGVELGKELSKKIANNDLDNADPSTKGLLSYIHKTLK